MCTGRAPRQNEEEAFVSRATSFSARMLSIVGSAPEAILDNINPRTKNLSKPLIQVLLDKIVVLQMGIQLANSVNLFNLPGREIFSGIKTPSARQQSLATQSFIDASNAATKIMRRIKDCGIGIGQLLCQSHKFRRDRS